MGWDAIHATAQEIELWTTLALNLWLIVGAVIFALGRLRKGAKTIGEQLVGALMTALIVMVLFSVPAFPVLMLGLTRGMSERSQGVLVAIFSIIFGVITYGGLVYWLRDRKR